MTEFIAAYDTEQPVSCLQACRRIVEIHQRYNTPATFFLIGSLLENEADEYKRLFTDDTKFEIASHTYSHQLLANHPICGSAVRKEQIRMEIVKSKNIIEDNFARKCIGIRPACSFAEGLNGEQDVIDEIARAGYRYVSSRLWGPDYTLPAPLEQAYTYTKENQGDLWEFPGHGWHDNVLKGYNATPCRLLLWPPVYPDALLTGYVKTVEQEFNVYKFFIDKAVEDNLEYVSLIWHPWSLYKFDPEIKMLDLVFDYVFSIGLKFTRFTDLWYRKSKQK